MGQLIVVSAVACSGGAEETAAENESTASGVPMDERASTSAMARGQSDAALPSGAEEGGSGPDGTGLDGTAALSDPSSPGEGDAASADAVAGDTSSSGASSSGASSSGASSSGASSSGASSSDVSEALTEETTAPSTDDGVAVIPTTDEASGAPSAGDESAATTSDESTPADDGEPGTSLTASEPSLTPCVVTLELDTPRTSSEPNDGTISYREVLTYDHAGHLLTKEVDADADGRVDSSRSNEYDDAGNLIRLEIDDNGDGSIAATYVHTYDSFGNQTSTRRFDANGELNYAVVSTFDELGRLLQQDEDMDGDGDVERRISYTYDGSGEVARVELSSPDRPESSFSTYVYTRDEAAGVVLVESVRSDGVPGTRTRYTYDAAGNRTSVVEMNASGEMYRGEWWEHDAAGNIVVHEVRETSLSAGRPYSREESTFDDRGNLVSQRWFGSEDGEPESWTTYTYDADGKLVTKESELMIASLNVHDRSLTSYTYDGQGRLLAIQRGAWLTVHTYDADGNLARTELDVEGDGIIDERTSYDYSCHL